MKPKCKLCGNPHWTYEEHTLKGTEELQKVGASVLRKSPMSVVPANKRTEPLSGRNKRTRGRPRKWATEAERKKAYRERRGSR